MRFNFFVKDSNAFFKETYYFLEKKTFWRILKRWIFNINLYSDKTFFPIEDKKSVLCKVLFQKKTFILNIEKCTNVNLVFLGEMTTLFHATEFHDRSLHLDKFRLS